MTKILHLFKKYAIFFIIFFLINNMYFACSYGSQIFNGAKFDNKLINGINNNGENILIYSLPQNTIIGSISYKVPSTVKLKDIKNFLFVKKGQRFSMTHVEKTIKSLYDTGYFHNIVVLSKIKNKLIYLRFLLFQRVYIKDINIYGLDKSGITKQKILSAIPLKSGRQFLNFYKTSSIKKIKKILLDSGYPDASVLISSYVLRKSQKYQININISLNQPVLISKVFINWKIYYPKKELGKMIQDLEGKPLNKELIKAFRKHLKKIYKKKGFLNSRVDLTRINYISKYKSILLFDIHPGYKIFFHFKGTKPYSANFIKNTVFDFKNIFVFDKATFISFKNVLRDFFTKEGYYFNAVSFKEIKNMKKDTINLYYDAKKENKVEIKSIIIKGNKPFSSSKILSLMKAHISTFFSRQYFYKKRLSSDISNIENFFNNEGYLNAKVSFKLLFSKNKKHVVIFLNIAKEVRTYVKQVSITSLPEKVAEQVTSYINKMKGKPFRIIQADNGKNLISTYLANNGYIFSKTRLKIVYSKNNKYVSLSYIVESGPQVIIKKIFIIGNTITKTSYIKTLLSFKKGQIYDQNKIIKTQNYLYRTGIFNSVRISLQNPNNVKRFKNIIVKVKDAKPIGLSFGGGYGTYTRYRGFIQIDDSNLFGSGKSISMRFSKSAIYTNLLIDYYDPAIYNYKGLAFNARALDADIITLNYTLHKEGVNFSLIRRFSSNLKGLLSYGMFYDAVSGLNQGAEITPRDVGFTRISSVSLATIYNSRNSILNPTSGNLTSLRLTYASSIIDSQINFAKLFFHTEEFIPFIYNTVFEYSLRFGYIKPLPPTEQVPINERFFLGGRTTVRGFPQDSIGAINQYGYPDGGDVMENYNLQLNIPVYKNFGIFIFQDGGNVFLSPSAIKPLALYKSAGAGIMYLSPIGPISFSYGYILTREPYWPVGGINFTIGTSF